MYRTGTQLRRLVLCVGLLLSSSSPPHALTLEENNVLAALTLNIVRFTTWPSEAQQRMKDTLDLCVVGDNTVQQSFTTIDRKPVGDKTLRVINLSRLSNFDQCHALYISELKQNILLQVFVETKKLPLLTIGFGEDFAEQGGMVGLENIDNKMKLHVNTSSVQQANLTISSRLLSLAKIIEGK